MMIILKHYNNKVKEWKGIGFDDEAMILKSVIQQYKDGEITDIFLQERYALLANDVEEAYIDECFNLYCEKEYETLRACFEDDLIENGYAAHTVSEVDDGWHDFKREAFCEDTFGESSVFFTTNQQYNKLL